jgi:hypothetical protein
MEPFAIYNAIRNKLVVAGVKMQIPNRCVSLLMSINYFLMKSKDYAGSSVSKPFAIDTSGRLAEERVPIIVVPEGKSLRRSGSVSTDVPGGHNGGNRRIGNGNINAYIHKSLT